MTFEKSIFVFSSLFIIVIIMTNNKKIHKEVVLSAYR